MSVTDEIKSRLNLVDVIGSTVQLKKAGRNYKGLCPFHSERTPSFVVYTDSQSWRCFGACNEGGDLFNFVMKREGWDFPEALKYLAQQAGVELEPMTAEQAGRSEARDRLRSLLSHAADFFHLQLLNAKEAAHARSYIDGRGLTEQTIASFGIGYAPNSWDAGSRHLIGMGYQMQELIDAGLVIVRDEGGTYDRFRDRVVIPIRDVRGSVVGFGARGLIAEAVPKYLNSPQSELFDKSSILFGLDLARNTIRDGETAVIVEGYMDTIQAHQAGFSNVIAQMGTALTEQQLKLLSRYATRLILALDPDAAGQMATDRGREVIERVSRAAAEQANADGVWDFDQAEQDYRATRSIEFDTRGMLRYETRLGFDIRVIVLPEGKDPDDLIREDPDAWAQLVESALPIVEYGIQTAIAGRDLNDPKVKMWVAGQVVPVINDIANAIERSHYRQRLARLLKVEERALFPEGPSAAPAKSTRASTRTPSGPVKPPHKAASGELDLTPTVWREAFGLAALLQQPRLIYRVNRVIAECMPPDTEGHYPSFPASLSSGLSSADFSHPEHRLIYDGWRMAIDQHEDDPIAYLLENLDPVVQARLRGWFDKPFYMLDHVLARTNEQITAEKITEAAIHALLELRRQRLTEHMQQLAFEVGDAEQNGGGMSWDLSELYRMLISARHRVDQAQRHFGAPGSSGKAVFAKPRTAT